MTPGPERSQAHPPAAGPAPRSTGSGDDRGGDFPWRYFDRVFLEPVLPEIIAWLGEPRGRLLDLGCGTGLLTEYFRRAGFEAWGIDIDEAVVREAVRARPRCDFQVGSVERLPYGDQTFRVVFSCSTLQYVAHERALSEVARVLAPGGKVVFVENLRRHPLMRLYRLLFRLSGRRHGPHTTPRRYLEWGELRWVFRRFTAVRCRPYNLTSVVAHAPTVWRGGIRGRPWPPILALLRRIDDWIMGAVPLAEHLCWTVLVTGRQKDVDPESDTGRP